MDCRPEQVASTQWHFCPDAPLAPGGRQRALVQARVLDEITGLPITVDEVITPDTRLALHTLARHAGNGCVGLSGQPQALFPELALTAAAVPLRVGAVGYLPLDLPGMLGPIAGFPASFAALDHGNVLMHRRGVSFNGRVVQKGVPINLPLPGANVQVDGVWPTFPPPDVMPAALMQPARLIGIAPGAYGPHGAANLARCDFIPDLPQTKRLLLPAARGATRLRLSDRHTLVVGMPLLIDPDDAGRREVVGIRAIDTSLSDDQPAWVDLDYPLAYLHRSPARIVPASIPATHDPVALSRPMLTGDPTACLANLPPWPDLSLLQVDDGIKPREYQWANRYEAMADGDGYFRLPRVSRHALLRLRVTHPTPPQPLLLVLAPDYGRAEQNLAVAFE